MSESAASAAPGAGAAALVANLGHLIGADVGSCDRNALDDLVARSQRMRNWLDSFDVRVATRARELAERGRSEPPDDLMRNRGRRSRRDAERATARSRACATVPGLEKALAEGRVTGEHVDAIANAAANLDDAGRAKLADLADEVIKSAAALPVEKFDRECRDLTRILSGDGLSRQQRHRLQRKVRRWVDRQTGMFKTLIELDAEADARMWTAIHAAVNDARHNQQSDDDRTYDQIQADVVVDLITGAHAVDPRVPEIAVLVDLDTLTDSANEVPDATVCETSSGQPVDVDTVRRLGCIGDLIAILRDGTGHVLKAGRAHRLATRAQRQALRAMYRTCAFPGCDVDFDRSHIHHVHWWEHLGPTDLDNLVPLCSLHHHLVHEGGWQLALTADRTITVHRPDGTHHYTGDTTNRCPYRHEPGEPAGPQQPNGDMISNLAAAFDDALNAVLARTGSRAPP